MAQTSTPSDDKGAGSRALGVIDPGLLREVAPGIFYSSSDFVLADHALIEFLKGKARTTPTRRARLCAHPSPDDAQHDMLIASHRDTYVAPHRHPKSESLLVLEGEADVLLFENDGRLAHRFTMAPAGSPWPMFYRMPAGRYHSLAIRSEVLVFAESTRGPFSRLDMEAAPWAPQASDEVAGRAFVAALPRKAQPPSTSARPAAQEDLARGHG